MEEKKKLIESWKAQGFTQEEILQKLKEFDQNEASSGSVGKQDDATNVDVSEASDNQTSDGGFKLEDGLSEFQQNNKLYEHNYNKYIKEGKDPKYANLFVKPPEIAQHQRADFLDEKGRGVKKETEFFKSFENELNKTLDTEFLVDRDKDGKVKDIKDKYQKEEVDYQNNKYGDNIPATDEEIYGSINKVIQEKFISKDPIIQRKQTEFNATLKPQVDEIQEKLLQKYQSQFGTSASGNEKIYNLMQKEFEKEIGVLQQDFYKDPDVQSRLQMYQKVQDGYFDKMNRKIKRNRDDLFKLYDNTGYLGDLMEGIDIGMSGIAQGFRGIGLQEEEKDLTNAQSRLDRLNAQLKANPESGDVEKEYITGIDVGVSGIGPGVKSKVKTKKGKLNDLIKEEEENIKKHTAIYEKRLDTYMKKGDRQALFNQYSITQGEVGLDDVIGTIGSVAPYMGVAMVPYVGAPIVAASSYGNQRQDVLKKQMAEKLGKDIGSLTAQDYIDFAKNNEEEIEEFYLGAGAIGMAYLERLGATRVAGKFTKAVGLGKSASASTYGSLLKGHFNKFAQGFGGRAKDMGISGFFEGGTELVQETMVGMSNYFGDENINDKSFAGSFIGNEYIDTAQLKEAGAAGLMVGMLLPGLGGIAKQTTVEMRTAARMFSTKFDLKNNPARAEQYFDGLKKELDRRRKLTKGNPLALNEEQYNQEVDYMQELYARSLKVKGNLDANVKHDIFNLMGKRDDLKRQLEDPNTDESSHKRLKDQINEINAQIENKQGVDFVEGGIKQLKDIGFTEDLDIDADKSTDELAKQFEGNEDAVKTSFGWYDPASNKMYVNSDLANTKGNVTTAQHEFLHPMTKALIQAGKIKKETITEMVGKYDKDGYVQGRLDADKETYTEEYLNQNPDEYLAMFGEGVAAKKINIEENFSGVKNFFRKAFKMAMPKSDIDFDSAEGLKNFMVEYSKSDREGKLTKNLLGSLKGVKQTGEGGDVVKSSNLKGRLDDFGGNKVRMINETLMNTKDGRMVDMDKVPLTESEFGQEIGGVVEDITKRLFDKIPPDLTRTLDENRQGARQKYKDALVTKAATILQNEFDPSKQKGQGLDSWLTQILNQRANSLATELGIESTFTKETTGQETEVEPETSPKVDKEFIDIRQGVFQIATDGEVYNKILNKVKDIVTRKFIAKKSGKKAILDFNNPSLRKDLNNIYQKEIRKILIQDGLIPKNKDEYKAWLKKNAKKIWPKLSQDVVNKRFPGLVTKVIDRQTRKQSKFDLNTKNINAGNALFIKNNIDSDAFAEYFESRGRKESLGQALAIELANDAVVQVMGDPDVLLKRNQEGLNKGTMQNETAVAAMAKVVQRPTDLVFSKAAAGLSVGNDQQRSDYDKIINTLKSKPFIKDISKYASDPSGPKFSSLYRIIKDHLKEAGLETLSNSEITTIANEFVPQAIKTDLDHNSDIENIGDVVSNYLVNTHEGDREVISVKAGVEGGFDKKDINVINNGRKAIKNIVTHLKNGFILDPNNPKKKIKLKSSDSDIGIITNSAHQPGSLAGFQGTKTDKDGKLLPPSNIEIDIKKDGLKPKDGAARVSLFLNKSDFNKNAGKLENQNSLLSELGKKDIYLKDKDGVIDPKNYQTLRKEGVKARKILKNYISDLSTLVDYGYLSNKQARILIENLFQDSKGLGRLAAVLSYVPTIGKKELIAALGLDPNDAFRFEHMIPANNIATLAYKRIINGDAQSIKDFESELENYKSSVIPVKLDDKLKDKGTQSIMGVKHELGKDPLDSRYEETLKFLEVHDLENGGTKGTNNFVFSKEHDKNIIFDKAMEMARRPNAPKKGITVMDFDDTLAKSKSEVLASMPDGTLKRLSASDFAKQADALTEQGAIFDFSQFNEVKKGQKGPLFDVIKKRVEKFGNKDVFILTARPQESAGAIKKFLANNGVNIPIENITGLEDGSPQAKADFMINKAANGYNDFYFADDAIKNVKAVKEVLDVIDVKSDVQQAKVVWSKRGAKSQKFNEILEDTKGAKAETSYSEAAGKTRGADKKTSWLNKFFIPPSAEDLMGLVYDFLGKGKIGEGHKVFFEENLVKPLNRGLDNLNRAKQALRNDYEALKKQHPKIHKMLKKDSGYNQFTNDAAVRIYLWTKNGIEIPGLSKTDIKKITSLVANNPEMVAFANKLSAITKVKEGYPTPGQNWLASNIGLDMLSINQKFKRGEYLKEFNDNVAEIFSKENINKIRALYGDNFVEALEDMLHRVQKGSNRTFGQNRLVNTMMTWLNSATGTIMFLNTRSAVLQTISWTNFINFSDNNILSAAKAMANQGQFWSDFGTLFNSDFLKQRRGGMQQDVNWQEISEAVKGSSNPVTRAISLLLEKGFIMTQIADSFAIGLGGATLYRNRMSKYLKEGMAPGDAEKQAFLDFMEIAEKTQQSGRPDLISQQQASPLGRVMLAFQNVTMQYNRLAKKEILDMVNNRREPGVESYTKSTAIKMGRVIYYMGVQNLVFNAMQNALFAMIFDDETDDEEKDRMFGTANGMADSILRGMGIAGGITATLKNMVLKFHKEDKKPAYNKDFTYVLTEAFNVSPPLGSKARKIYSALQTYKFNEKEIKKKGISTSNTPGLEAAANVISAATNAPTDRIFYKIESVGDVLNNEYETWQRIAMALGRRDWQLGVDKPKPKPPTVYRKERSSGKRKTGKRRTQKRK